MTDRKNAMLTTEDRRWLTGEKSYEGEHAKQQRYQRRRDIRKRVHNTILDFTILFEHLEDAEREKLFECLEDDESDDEFEAGLRDGLAFILYNAGITETMLEECSHGTESTAERLLREAVDAAGKRDEILIEDVAISIDATRAPIASIVAELKAGNEVSPAELCLLLESEAVDTDAARDCLRELVVDAE
ncbi:hypothetical protein [Natronococcus occultus]|uniref:Domain of unknown function domain-containing protein n=1 Tax=Natronococcus occultus SP4 TaxID=694430 RepID=L0K3L8_9EURY|nr:hypothetical protein [Natronococcus occultus]AGB39867.1 hypothetical protein Natoc_4161 [Natronococcus occultus SP4]